MTLCQSIITQNVIYINRFGVFLFGAYLTIAIFEDGLLVVFKVCTKSKTPTRNVRRKPYLRCVCKSCTIRKCYVIIISVPYADR